MNKNIPRGFFLRRDICMVQYMISSPIRTQSWRETDVRWCLKAHFLYKWWGLYVSQVWHLTWNYGQKIGVFSRIFGKSGFSRPIRLLATSQYTSQPRGQNLHNQGHWVIGCSIKQGCNICDIVVSSSNMNGGLAWGLITASLCTGLPRCSGCTWILP